MNPDDSWTGQRRSTTDDYEVYYKQPALRGFKTDEEMVEYLRSKGYIVEKLDNV